MHTIRLREPWNIEQQADGVLYRRYFNQPTGLGPASVVHLAIDQLPEDSQVTFNDVPLATAAAWDITAGLQPRNLILIEIRGRPLAERPFSDVRLEIHEGLSDVG
jgi:hypothetical protein